MVLGMHEETADCSELIRHTADAIDDDTLKLLFVSVQQNNMEICIDYALLWVAIHFPWNTYRRLTTIIIRSVARGMQSVRLRSFYHLTMFVDISTAVTCDDKDLKDLLTESLSWFPHIWVCHLID